MSKADRAWERQTTSDGEVSQSAQQAIAVAFGLAVIVGLVVVGFSLAGLAAGFGLGIVVSLALTWLVRRSNRGSRSDGPPPQLL